jgi:chloride channel protein, CIC family
MAMETSASLISHIQRFFRKLYFSQSDQLSKQLFRFTKGETVLILIAAIIGMVMGAVVLLFNWAVEFAGEEFAKLSDPSLTTSWLKFALFPLVAALGGLLVGLAHKYVFRTAPSHGVPEIILASRFARGKLQRRTIISKILTAALSIGSGGGGGREGPIIHLGGAAGYGIGKLFRLTSDQSRTLISCGAAAGISGIFNAPMGGVMFALEVILGDFRLKTFTPIVVASVAATAITRNFYGNKSLVTPAADLHIVLPEYLLFALLGIVMGFMSAYFIRTVMIVEKKCKTLLPQNPVLKPAIGGLLAGVLVAFLPELLEQTYDPVNAALNSQLPILILLVVALLKPIHVALTTGSGGTGGVFAPALKSGAMIGSAFGFGMMALFPETVNSPAVYALCAMGAILAGTMHAPLTGVLILVEISGDYSMILPAMLTATITSMIAQRIAKNSIYSSSLQSEGKSIGSYAYVPLMNSFTIEQIVERGVAYVSPHTPLPKVIEIFESTRHEAVLILNDEKSYLGMIEFEDVRSFITETDTVHTLVAADVMVTSIKPVFEDTTLDVVMKLFDDYGWTALPVIQHDDTKRAVGLVTEHDAQKFYRRTITREA